MLYKFSRLRNRSSLNITTDEDLKRKWIAFLDREDVHSIKTQSHKS